MLSRQLANRYPLRLVTIQGRQRGLDAGNYIINSDYHRFYNDNFSLCAKNHGFAMVDDLCWIPN